MEDLGGPRAPRSLTASDKLARVEEKLATTPRDARRKKLTEESGRTAITYPFWTKQGLEQWMQVDKEENERLRKLIKEDKIQGFDKVRYGLVGRLPGYFRRGFYDAFEAGNAAFLVEDAEEFVGKEAEPEMLKERETGGFWKPFQGSDENVFTNPGLNDQIKKREAEVYAMPREKKQKPKPPPGVQPPPAWTKDGQAFIDKYGLAATVETGFQGTGAQMEDVKGGWKANGYTAGGVDPQWGMFKEDPIKNNAFVKILQDLSEQGNRRYGEKSEYVQSLKAGTLDPAAGDPFRQSLNRIDDAIRKEDKGKPAPLFNTAAIEATMIATNVKPILERLGMDTKSVDKLLTEKEKEVMEVAKQRDAEREKAQSS
jgi:hypothetical protein